MPKLVVISKGQPGLTFELGSNWVTIGRAADNVFQIVESSVSGHHCEVQLRGTELFIRDMRSTNGTHVRGERIAEGTLQLGESFRLGDVELRFEVSRAAVPVVTVPPPVREPEGKGAKTAAVLLVDDSMAFLETASELFTTLAGGTWAVHPVTAADQALALLQQKRMDLVILDINMPMLDGIQLLSMIHRRYPDVKKVVLSGHLTESNRAACLAGGAELVLEKPPARDGFKMLFNVLQELISWNQREGFSGTLRQVGLVDVIQLECIARKSCILEVRDARTVGEIYIESGVIVHAATGELSGDPAFYKLLALVNGEFHLLPFRQPPAQTVQGSWEFLLMESARIRDEARQTQAAADTIHMVNQEPSPHEHMGVLGEDIVVVSTYDGQWHPADEQK
jgi:CheY-like chemotaxis protein